MNNTFGNRLCVTLFGESHGTCVGVTLDGLTPGLPVKEEHIAAALARRRPADDLSTARREADDFSIVSGVIDGHTTGTPLTLLIQNADAHSADYRALADTPRPSHADYTAAVKYHGQADMRGGGHFSGRLSAPLVAAGALLEDALASLGILIGVHIDRIGGVSDLPFSEDAPTLEKQIASIAGSAFPVLDRAAGERMKQVIRDAAAEADSVGGILAGVVYGLPAGIGEPWFDTVEGMLAHALFSVPAVKGVSFGAGFDLAAMRGSEANDPFTVENGKIVTASNRSGGINGGITNGMPVTFRVALRPTPSIGKTQKTVSLSGLSPAEVTIGGRHDPCIVHRATSVVRAMTALCVADLLLCRFGDDGLLPGGTR